MSAAAAAAAPAPAAAPKGAPAPRTLSMPDKVATLLLAMGPGLAGSLLKHFDEPQLRRITRAAAELAPVPVPALDDLIDEFEQQFSVGVDLRGNPAKAEELLTGVLAPEQVADIMSEIRGSSNKTLWERLSGLPEATLAAHLAREHPQTAALILTRVDTGCAARIVGLLPPKLRNELMRRMLVVQPVGEPILRLLEGSLQTELLAGGGRKSDAVRHTRMADIINKMERDQMQEVLASLGEAKPKDAETLKGMLFAFEDIGRLPKRARMSLFDQVPTERVILALNGVDAEFREAVLSSLASRARRIVEHELASGGAAAPKEVAKARRMIADLALQLAEKGEIELRPEEAAEAA